MANPGQSIPPGQMSNADQAMDTGMMPRDPNADESDHLLDSDEVQTLEHGGYGGEQEYTDRPQQADRAAGSAGAGDDEYINQTDMTDQTGDRSESERAERVNRSAEHLFGDEGSFNDTEHDDDL
ncbi:MAG: hypothetical protein ACXWQR_21220 [Ktedonobacterales bacterium]